MSCIQDGPSSPLFTPLTFEGNASLTELAPFSISDEMAEVLTYAPSGNCTGWGIRFNIGDVVVIDKKAVAIEFAPTRAHWFIFVHTSDQRPARSKAGGFVSPMRGAGQLAEHAADYVLVYQDGTEERAAIRRRHQLGAFQRRWGENCFEAVGHWKPFPVPPLAQPDCAWGSVQGRVRLLDAGEGNPRWVNWLWAWENPHPDKAVAGVRFEPVSGLVIVSAVSAGNASSNPLRWRRRRKACLKLAPGEPFRPDLNERGLLPQIQLDLGQVISATARPLYPNDQWENSYNNQLPVISENEVLVEYTAHEDAHFHLAVGQDISGIRVKDVEDGDLRNRENLLDNMPVVTKRVRLRAIEQGSGKAVPVKLHVHGEWGEYLSPVDRHRIPNPAWFEDYSVDFVHRTQKEPDRHHYATYISGETEIDVPLGKLYVEVSKGFEVQPVRTVFEVRPDTQEIVIELEKILPWREKGWVTADTHVHFLSPMSALLEGAAEGVNVVNLLASQWGELMTNVGDFDGRMTWGSREAGGDGEYLVRVGTENRQHVLGHISLLGYRGNIIAPMTTSGPDESALGDPIEILLTEWARQCKKQGGLVVLPHFPDPRGESAASIVGGDVDAVEMTSTDWRDLYDGIDPYSLSDWYRYLNCGYLVPAVGGTDKMSAVTAVGTVRTYARIASNQPFTYDAWMEAVQRGETFVTYGPLLDFAVDGYPMGSRIEIQNGGGRLDVSWEVASVTVPTSRVELMVNGEIRESVAVPAEGASGQWSVRIDSSSWLALLVRGHYSDRPEIITAHSTPVMVTVGQTPILAAADAVTILEQIEGALAYLDTIGTRADDSTYKRMRMVLTSAHRTLHNRMHEVGYYHDHTAVTDHPEHH